MINDLLRIILVFTIVAKVNSIEIPGDLDDEPHSVKTFGSNTKTLSNNAPDNDQSKEVVDKPDINVVINSDKNVEQTNQNILLEENVKGVTDDELIESLTNPDPSEIDNSDESAEDNESNWIDPDEDDEEDDLPDVMGDWKATGEAEEVTLDKPFEVELPEDEKMLAHSIPTGEGMPEEDLSGEESIQPGIEPLVPGEEPPEPSDPAPLNTDNEGPHRTLSDEEVANLQAAEAASITDEDYINEFDEVPPVSAPKVEKKPSPGDLEVHTAEAILSSSKPNYRKAYRLLEGAAALNNSRAQELIADAVLTGEHLPHNISKAYELYAATASQGSPGGQFGLGLLYGLGLHVQSSQAKALLYYTFAALGGDTGAQMALAYRYWSGIGVAQSCESALTYYTLVADQVARRVGAHGRQPVHRIKLMEEEEAPHLSPLLDEDLVQYYQFLADKGDLQAQLGLGQLYYQGGRGVERNLALAQQYFSAAARAGNANANAFLGKLYAEGGYDVKKDYTLAIKYYKLAAKDNNPVGECGLGLMYYHGWGVEQNYKIALSHLTSAASHGHTEAELQIGLMFLSGVGVEKDYGKALKHFNTASQSGHVLAFYNLGMMHAGGVGVMRSCQTAAELLKNVAERGTWSYGLMDAHTLYHKGNSNSALVRYMIMAEQGYEVAQSNTAFIFDKEDTEFIAEMKDRYKRAFVNWKRAAAQGAGGARLKLGDYYYYGQGTASDPDQAAQQYQLASDVDANPQAMFNLGYMHELGIGRRQDNHLAKRYYDMAATTSPDANVPVMLAVTKLKTKIFIDWAKNNYQELSLSLLLQLTIGQLSSISESVTALYGSIGETITQIESAGGEEWDIYLMSILAVLLGLLLAVRGHHVRVQQQRAAQALLLQQQQQQQQQHQPPH